MCQFFAFAVAQLFFSIGIIIHHLLQSTGELDFLSSLSALEIVIPFASTSLVQLVQPYLFLRGQLSVRTSLTFELASSVTLSPPSSRASTVPQLWFSLD
ncbi:hypothetical protein BCV70DRAFT_11520 [Testicularia cyperi]|uniref:Uncharacterized protein n=1 Tax=Testicularia cyperi TaxID=1882483 RepID=A0A317XXU0_9BASI|nr:hypothetical protein BCV70DRAFT_11520 [Testicularia cyperi]